MPSAVATSMRSNGSFGGGDAELLIAGVLLRDPAVGGDAAGGPFMRAACLQPC